MPGPRRLVAVAALAALASVLPEPAGAAEPTCNKWDLEASCATSVPRVAAGEPFVATLTVKNTGDMPLVQVVLSLRPDLGARTVGDAPSPVRTTIERLEPGESKELTGTFTSDQVGLARIIGGTRDTTGWAAAGCACTVEVLGLPALESDLADMALTEGGGSVGQFFVGDMFRYVLTVSDDGGSAQSPDMKAVFTLPKELEFVSGSGDKQITVTGNGQTATTSPFFLTPKETVKIEVRVKVLAAPPSNLVQTRASIQTVTGIELEQQAESTTLK
jgi:hypothetical protein